METENRELEINEKQKKDRYRVEVKYNTELMKRFFEFYNRVKHPRATISLTTIGVMLTALPILNEGIATPGVVICFVMGPLLIVFGLFRQYLSVWMTKKSSTIEENADMCYMFSDTSVTVDTAGKVERMGNYKKIYRIWEDEKTFYVGMNEDDLLVLPKDKFTEGDPDAFRDFIVEKSRCEYRWKPVKLNNKMKQMKEDMKNMDSNKLWWQKDDDAKDGKKKKPKKKEKKTK